MYFGKQKKLVKISMIALLIIFSNCESYERQYVFKKGDIASIIVGKKYSDPNIFYKFPKDSRIYQKYGEMLSGETVDKLDLWKSLPVGTEVYFKRNNNRFGKIKVPSFAEFLELSLLSIGVIWVGIKIKNIHKNKKRLNFLKNINLHLL